MGSSLELVHDLLVVYAFARSAAVADGLSMAQDRGICLWLLKSTGVLFLMLTITSTKQEIRLR